MDLTRDDILTPLAIAVIVDHKVREIEQSAFTEQALGLLEMVGHEEDTHETLLEWFQANHRALEDQLWEKGGNTLVLRSLTRFQEEAHREAVFDALVSISVADGEYVHEESRLIKSAAAVYGYDRPPIKIDR